MYNTQGSQVDLGQYLANLIQSEANKGPVQHFVWQLASANQYQNEFFVKLLNVMNSLCAYWAATQPNQTIDQAAMTVYMCACGMKVAQHPEWHRQMSQADTNTWLGWADYTAKLDVELTNFESGYAPRFAPVSNAHSSWDTAQYSGPSFGQPQGNWAQPDNTFAHPQQPAYGGVADWAARPAQNVAPINPRAQQQQSAITQPQGSGYSSRSARASQKAPESPQYTPADPNAPPVFTQARSGYRSRSATGNRFDPEDPVHQPVGREVAEAHEAAASVEGSWGTSNFDWDDSSIVFGDHATPTKPAAPEINSTNTNVPQFMERFSSNKDVGGLVYDKEVNGERQELTIEDWRTNPDPDFPWEMGYRPATHTRRIAYDTKRKCYVQQIEENKVKYEDHAILNQSSAVRTTMGSRHNLGKVGRGFDGDSSVVATLPGMIEERGRIIDHRLERAKEHWDKQEQAAQEAVEKGGSNYVAPELEPSREDAISTPLDSESAQQVELAKGKIAKDQLVVVDLANAGFVNEQHAAFAMQAKLVVDGFDFSQAPIVSARYLELSPFVIADENPEEILEKLEPLTDDTTLTSFVQIAQHLSSIAGEIPADIWNTINDQLTAYVNGVLSTELGLPGVSIESFAEDCVELPEYLRTKKGPQYVENLSRRISEFVRPMVCVINTNLTDAMFEEVLSNVFPNMTPESKIDALNDDSLMQRTVLVRRECTLSRTSLSSAELGIYADTNEFVITNRTMPDLYNILKMVLAATARDDGKAGYFKRVLLTSDGVRFTLHEGWMANGEVLILKR